MILDKGTLLAEGKGQGSKMAIMFAAIYAVLAIVCFVYAFTRETMTQRVVFIVLGLFLLAHAPIMWRAISKTFIRVYENVVEGRSLSSRFYLNDIRPYYFSLPYDQVYVEVKGELLVVNGGGYIYKVYVGDKGHAIQAVIRERKNQLAEEETPDD